MPWWWGNEQCGVKSDVFGGDILCCFKASFEAWLLQWLSRVLISKVSFTWGMYQGST